MITYLIIIIIIIILIILPAIYSYKLYMKMTKEKISEFLILNKFGKKIQQYVSIKSFLKQSISLNYYDGEPKNIDKILDKSFDDFENFINNTKYKTLYTSTNSLMERRLKKLERKGLIILKRTSKKIKCKRQFIERLTLMGLRTSLYNLFNTKYWEYIFTKVNLKEFEIIIIKNI